MITLPAFDWPSYYMIRSTQAANLWVDSPYSFLVNLAGRSIGYDELLTESDNDFPG